MSFFHPNMWDTDDASISIKQTFSGSTSSELFPPLCYNNNANDDIDFNTDGILLDSLFLRIVEKYAKNTDNACLQRSTIRKESPPPQETQSNENFVIADDNSIIITDSELQLHNQEENGNQISSDSTTDSSNHILDLDLLPGGNNSNFLLKSLFMKSEDNTYNATLTIKQYYDKTTLKKVKSEYPSLYKLSLNNNEDNRLKNVLSNIKSSQNKKYRKRVKKRMKNKHPWLYCRKKERMGFYPMCSGLDVKSFKDTVEIVIDDSVVEKKEGCGIVFSGCGEDTSKDDDTKSGMKGKGNKLKQCDDEDILPQITLKKSKKNNYNDPNWFGVVMTYYGNNTNTIIDRRTSTTPKPKAKESKKKPTDVINGLKNFSYEEMLDMTFLSPQSNKKLKLIMEYHKYGCNFFQYSKSKNRSFQDTLKLRLLLCKLQKNIGDNTCSSSVTSSMISDDKSSLDLSSVENSFIISEEEEEDLSFDDRQSSFTYSFSSYSKYDEDLISTPSCSDDYTESSFSDDYSSSMYSSQLGSDSFSLYDRSCDYSSYSEKRNDSEYASYEEINDSRDEDNEIRSALLLIQRNKKDSVNDISNRTTVKNPIQMNHEIQTDNLMYGTRTTSRPVSPKKERSEGNKKKTKSKKDKKKVTVDKSSETIPTSTTNKSRSKSTKHSNVRYVEKNQTIETESTEKKENTPSWLTTVNEMQMNLQYDLKQVYDMQQLRQVHDNSFVDIGRGRHDIRKDAINNNYKLQQLEFDNATKSTQVVKSKKKESKNKDKSKKKKKKSKKAEELNVEPSQNILYEL